MDNATENQIYPKISLSHNTSLRTDCTIKVTKTHVTTIIRHEKQTDNQNNEHLQAFSITAHY